MSVKTTPKARNLESFPGAAACVRLRTPIDGWFGNIGCPQNDPITDVPLSSKTAVL